MKKRNSTLVAFDAYARNLAATVKRLAVPEQDRQCTYNVTLRRIYETIFAVEKQ